LVYTGFLIWSIAFFITVLMRSLGINLWGDLIISVSIAATLSFWAGYTIFFYFQRRVKKLALIKTRIYNSHYKGNMEGSCPSCGLPTEIVYIIWGLLSVQKQPEEVQLKAPLIYSFLKKLFECFRRPFLFAAHMEVERRGLIKIGEIYDFQKKVMDRVHEATPKQWIYFMFEDCWVTYERDFEYLPNWFCRACGSDWRAKPLEQELIEKWEWPK